MTILHVCKKYPPALGGDTVVVSNLEQQQRAAGHRVIIATSAFAELPRRAELYTFGLRDTGAHLDAITPRRLISLVMLAFQIFNIVRRERPDIIHTHSIDMAFAISCAARLYHIPIVHTFHIVTFYDAHQSRLRRLSELWLARRAGLSRITAPNSHDVAKLQAAGLTQTVLLPNGVDIDYWRLTGSRSKKSEVTFVAIGRLEKQKGYEYLVRAAGILTRHGALFRVVIIGEGSLEPSLTALARQLKAPITFAGRQTPEQTRALLSGADVVVQPSLYETTPLTLLEAWAAGKPVIATPVGILRHKTTDLQTAAQIVPIADEQALADAMLRLMNERDTRTTIAENARQVVQQYHWPQIAKQADIIYRGVI